MKKKRLKRVFLTMLILALICPIGSARAVSFSEIDHDLTNLADAPLAIVQTIQGSLPRENLSESGIFTYRITALTPGAPTPKDGETLTLTGDSIGYFRFDFSGSRADDLFEYEIRQEKNGDEGWSWDASVYRVCLQVMRCLDGSLELNLIIQSGETKDPLIEFTNTCTSPVAEKPGTSVISSQPNTFTGILGFRGALVLIGLIIPSAAGAAERLRKNFRSKGPGTDV